MKTCHLDEHDLLYQEIEKSYLNKNVGEFKNLHFKNVKEKS